MRYLFLAFFALTSGCDQRTEQLLDALSGHETQIVILAKEPTTLGPTGITLKSNEPMKVVGETANVCLVLKGGVPLAPQPEMQRIFEEALSGAHLSSVITLKSGQTFHSSRIAQSWSKYGKFTSQDEISACLSCDCGPKPSIGSEVGSIEIKASSPIRVLGMYWESSNAFDSVSKKTGN